MELIKGRPANEADRLDKEIRVYDLLDQLGMEYYRTDHEPGVISRYSFIYSSSAKESRAELICWLKSLV